MQDPSADLTLLVPMVQAHVSKVLASDDPLDPDLVGYSPLIRTYALECLDHFFRCDRPWLKHPHLQQVMQQKTTHQVLGHAYLLYAALAISAAHLALLQPEHVSYKTLSLVLWQKSLRAYYPCLLEKLESQSADALFFASHLHSMLASVNAHRQAPEQQWRLPAWLLSLRGVKALWDLPPVITHLRQGMWQHWVEECNLEWVRTSHELADPPPCPRKQSQIVRTLRALCTSLGAEESDIYKSRIRTLELLERLNHSPKATNLLSWFITRASQEFIARLQSGREMALLLLLYWYRLAAKIGQWWLVLTAKPEFDRLYIHISKRCRDESICELLEAMKGIEV